MDDEPTDNDDDNLEFFIRVFNEPKPNAVPATTLARARSQPVDMNPTGPSLINIAGGGTKNGRVVPLTSATSVLTIRQLVPSATDKIEPLEVGSIRSG